MDEDGYIVDEDQMGRDFMGFLANLAEVFPSLKTRPLYLIGEVNIRHFFFSFTLLIQSL